MDEIETLMTAYGYRPIESRNPYMRSYSKEGTRINYYFTSGTVTLQKSTSGRPVVLKNASCEKLEDYL